MDDVQTFLSVSRYNFSRPSLEVSAESEWNLQFTYHFSNYTFNNHTTVNRNAFQVVTRFSRTRYERDQCAVHFEAERNVSPNNIPRQVFLMH